MISLLLDGSVPDIEQALAERCPFMPRLPAVKRQLLDYQMHALYHLAQQHNVPGARMLEIGTGRGASGYVLAKAAPQATIISLTTDQVGAMAANGLWAQAGCRNIAALVEASWDYLVGYTGANLDLIFVDGDHNQIARDLPWFNHLRTGGLMVFHDYSPAGSPRPSAICHAALDEMAARLGRPFDVRIVDDERTGMVGFYRRAGEIWAA